MANYSNMEFPVANNSQLYPLITCCSFFFFFSLKIGCERHDVKFLYLSLKSAGFAVSLVPQRIQAGIMRVDRVFFA